MAICASVIWLVEAVLANIGLMVNGKAALTDSYEQLGQDPG
jgi:hypothetical protein